MEFCRYVQAILRGDYCAARVEPPRFSLADLGELARAALLKAARPRPFPDPRHVAVALKLKLISRAPRGLCGEGTALGRVAFRWDPDPQVLGMRVMHGVAHAILDGDSGPSSDSDAWQLTGLLFVPEHRVALARERLDLATVHAPPWLVMSRLMQASTAISAHG